MDEENSKITQSNGTINNGKEENVTAERKEKCVAI